MGITPQTKVHDLIDHHPYLLDFLVSYNSEYEKLKNPVIFNTVGRFATLATAAEMAKVPVAELIEAIEREVALHRIHEEPAVGAGAGTPADATGRAERQEQLKAIIGKLHDGASVEAVKAEFDALVQNVDAMEIAAMEQALIAEGMPVEEVQRLCDVHVTVFREALETADEDAHAVPAGHPVDTYRRENLVAGEILGTLRCSLEEAESLAAEDSASLTDALSAGLRRLLDGLTLHYTRKENQLFPLLEAHGIEGPTKVMWGLDDDIRGRLKVALALVENGRVVEAAGPLAETLGMVEDMIYKEEKILFPAALDALSEGEWDAMAAGEAEIGFAWIEAPESVGAAPGSASGVAPAAVADVPAGVSSHEHALPLTTGALSLEQLDLMLRTMPFDVTFVDETGRVRYYSEGERVFPRSPAIIGREVHNCHPPKSVATVERIVAEFEAGTKDTAEFWIEMGERFVHIRYFALRDAEGTYKGVLEVSQDVTGIRALDGQRRLLDWE